MFINAYRSNIPVTVTADEDGDLFEVAVNGHIRCAAYRGANGRWFGIAPSAIDHAYPVGASENVAHLGETTAEAAVVKYLGLRVRDH